MSVRFAFRFALIWLIPAVQVVSAQEAAVAETANLPDGKQVYDDYLAATGGRDARSKVKTQRMSGQLKMEIPGVGEIAAPIEVFQASPDKFQLIVDFTDVRKNVGEQ